MPCPFCMIASNTPPSTDPAIINSPFESAYPVLSTPIVVAFLDIAPLSPGHLLVCPRRHAMKASEMAVAESAALGFWLPVLTKAVLKSVGTTPEEASWNILQANGTESGQTVPHSHFHIIPRVGLARDANEITDAERQNIVLGEGPREKLDAEDGKRISRGIKSALKEEIEKLKTGGEIVDMEGALSIKVGGNGLKL
ncbi:HIT-like domain-containing protein [Leptodontidium sp. 2 PMI_412]|nr:HIT-like domain-containing protein [Leptodontidium sp. MPI-SDFR-AT-0119]KAH9211137.1 HIT-like domain-containing protein [Leptodontidium sp. 2 PMI_412]